MTDINKETVYVTINSARRIPFLNASGPIQTPISILKTVAAQLKALGYPVKEHPYVSINPATGNRSVVTEESFVALQPGQLVEVETTDPEPGLVPTTDDTPPASTDVVIVEQPEEIQEEPVPEETDNTEESKDTLEQTEETTETETSDEATENESNSDTVEEEEVAEPGDDDTSDAEELDVYEYAVYEGWSKQLLINYLRKAEDFLPEDVRKETNSATKPRLLEIIKQYIIDAA